MNINKILTIPLPVDSSTKIKLATDTDNSFNDEIHGIVPRATKTEMKTSNIWDDLSIKYDITSATFNELNEISSTLYELGEISLKEHALLTFDLNRAIEFLKPKTSDISSNFPMYPTNANETAEINWINEFQVRADQAFISGNIIGQQAHLNLITILQKISSVS